MVKYEVSDNLAFVPEDSYSSRSTPHCTSLSRYSEKGGPKLSLRPDEGPVKQPDVIRLRDTYGPNTVDTGRKRSWYQILFSALVHPFNILLTLLAILSGVTDETKTMGIMLFMVFLSTMLRFYQEFKSEVAAASLLEFIATKVLVIRNEPAQGRDFELSIPSTELVPGDWVKLFPGDLVPADVRLLESKDFHVSQAALTGEAIPVPKYIDHRYSKVTNDAQSVSNESVGSTTKVLPSKPSKKPSSPSSDAAAPLIRFFRSLFGMPVFSEDSFDPESAMESDLDKPDMCFMGSAVVSGTALCKVIYTGSRTHFGKMATELAKRRPQNAFQLGVRRISWIFFLTMAILIPPVLLLQKYLVNSTWGEAFIFSLAVAVGLTPEMLPMIVNTTLSKGAVQMSRKHCIVKKLDAIINMGGIDILCTDKTGTLTKSIVSLHRYVNRHGISSSVPLFLGYLNAYFQSVQQNPLDSAINSFFDLIITQNYERSSFRKSSSSPHVKTIKDDNIAPSVAFNITGKFAVVDELPFDFVRRRMSVILREVQEAGANPNSTILICKGAVEEVLSQCTRILNSQNTTNVYNVIRNLNVEHEPMTSEALAQLQKLNETLSEDGLRVIAVAYRTLPPMERDESLEDSGSSYRVEDESDLIFAGFLAFLDPPKDDSKEAIRNLLEHNVNVKVLTGDSPLVCKKICNEIGLKADKVVTGKDIAALAGNPEKLQQVAEEACIFAKLTPIQKSDIVRALKKKGHIVGFLGDGINDAPALTEADVGISVDSGTDICKESADIILLEKDLTVVVDAVITGRLTYGNTLKYIVMAVSSNFGNVFSILAASAWLPFEPMGSLHILTQNLLYDISQIAIPWDHMDPEFLQVPHRWSMKSVLKFMVMIGPWSSVFDISTFLFMYYYFGIQSKENPHQVLIFQTAWFTVGLLTQTLIVHMIRTPKIPFIQSWASLPVVVMTIIIMGLGLALPYIPEVSEWLHFVHLPWEVYPFLAAVLLAYCVAAQVAKVIYIKLFKEWY